jgi:predicted DNA binding CopG/RHH family protein
MTKFNVPKRVYSDGDKKLISFRLPESLLEELKKVSTERGWPMTDLVITVLDQYLQWNEKQKD